MAHYECVRTSGFYAWLIRTGTRSPYNHAYLVFQNQIFEADPGGARWRNLDEYGTDQVIRGPELDGPQTAAALRKAHALEGTPYGWLDIARLALRTLGLQWGWLTRAADEERAMICSQLVAALGEAAGVDWLCGRETTAAVTPADLATLAGEKCRSSSPPTAPPPSSGAS